MQLHTRSGGNGNRACCILNNGTGRDDSGQIYQIPPSHPKHSVTYVHVYESTPTTVTTGYTSGYKGEYVAAGVLLFGVGMVGAALEDDDDHYHYGWPPSPAFYPYGGARHYSYAYGGYYSAAHAYGPYSGRRR